jgi:hypothetical protein
MKGTSRPMWNLKAGCRSHPGEKWDARKMKLFPRGSPVLFPNSENEIYKPYRLEFGLSLPLAGLSWAQFSEFLNQRMIGTYSDCVNRVEKTM